MHIEEEEYTVCVLSRVPSRNVYVKLDIDYLLKVSTAEDVILTSPKNDIATI